MAIPFSKIEFFTIVNQNVKILGRRLYSPSLKDVAVLEVAELFFLIFPAYICIYTFPCEPRLDVRLPSQIYGRYKTQVTGYKSQKMQ